MIKTAVILAAGLGSRMGEKTKNKPKAFIEFDNKSIIEYSIEKLLAVGITEVIIGTGYYSDYFEKLGDKYPVKCIKSINYSTTGSLTTFYNLREQVKADFLLLESDLLYDSYGLKALLEDYHKNIILSSSFTGFTDEVFIEIDQNKNLKKMSKNKEDLLNPYSELVGICKISYNTFQKICDFAAENLNSNPKLNYEDALVEISKIDGIFVLKIDNYVWCEIDDPYHLNIANNIIFPRIRNV